MRDPESGNSKGFAFINYASFEASDAAIDAMNGQYLCNRPISVSYAFKKDSKGERHGSAAERLAFVMLNKFIIHPLENINVCIFLVISSQIVGSSESPYSNRPSEPIVCRLVSP